MRHVGDIAKSEPLRRLLVALYHAGSDGITSWDLSQAARTVALSSRVNELRKQGVGVHCQREPGSGVVYRYRLESIPKSCIRRECAWCGRALDRSAGPIVSHGVCVTCSQDKWKREEVRLR